MTVEKKGQGEEKEEEEQGVREVGGRRTATIMRKREKQKRTRTKYPL